MSNNKIKKLRESAEKIRAAKYGERGPDLHINSHQVIEEYQEWRAESENLFQQFFDDSNTQYKKFISLPTGGNGYVLMGYFNQQYPIFKVLCEKIESGEVQVVTKQTAAEDDSFNSEEKTVFVSHSAKDKYMVTAFVDLILQGALSIPINKIFCISTEGTKIKSGEDWRNSINDSLISAKINFLIITPNYKESEVCMNEMGAAWVTSARVLPLIVEPINYKTVGVIQEPRQIEKLLDEGSLDRVKDIVQESLKIAPTQIKSDRWTAKKKEFIAKVNSYLASNPFQNPLDRTTFNALQDENKDLNKTINSLIEEKTALEALVQDLEKIKDKAEVEKVIMSHRPNSDYDSFKSVVEKIKKQIKVFSPIIRGMVFRDYSNKAIQINWESYREQIDDALANDFIDDELYVDSKTTTEMRNLYSSLNELSDIISADLDDSFYNSYEKEFDAPLKLDNKTFWEQVFKATIIF